MTAPTLRRYTAADEDAAIALWQRSWQATYPDIDFAERVAWWRGRWRRELVPYTSIVLAERDGAIVGFLTIDAKGYLDQIVVAPENWGNGIAEPLLAEAKRISPEAIELLVNKNNTRAIRFYEKNGFDYAGEDVNPVSGRPVNRMRWRPAS